MTQAKKDDRQAKDVSTVRSPSLFQAAIPVVILIGLLAFSVFLFGDAASEGPNQVALLFASMVAALVGRWIGHSWSRIKDAVTEGVSVAIGAMLILLAVGALIGTWSMSGTIVSMVYYRLQILSAQYFYVATCILCALVGMSLGSSWTVAGTLGVGLMGIAATLNLSPEITAGAIICGAYLGDQMSPLSDTTNVAVAVVETDIFSHIRHMLWVTVPALVVSCGIFYFLGVRSAREAGIINLEMVQDVLKSHFTISPVTLIPLAVVLVLALRKIPASVSIFSGALLGGLLAVFMQPSAVQRFADDPRLPAALASLKGVWKALFGGYFADTGFPRLDALVSRGGMNSMLGTVWLIIAALTFGAILEQCGMLGRILTPLLRRARSTGRLIATSALTCVGCNILMADQYIAIALPGRMYRTIFQKRGLSTRNLSLVLGTSATITSPLVPWNTCGAYMAATLGVATWSYLPFCFFNWLSPLLAVAFGLIGFRILPLKDSEIKGEGPQLPVSEERGLEQIMDPLGRKR